MPTTTKTFRHPEFDAQVARWQRCRDAYDGADAVKARGEVYLPRITGQSNAEYEAYKARASFFNVTDRTVDAFTGLVFRKPMDTQVPDRFGRVRADLDRVTADGHSLQMFGIQAVKEVLISGRAIALLDAPAAVTPSFRPFWSLYPAEALTDWRARQGPDGSTVLTRAVLMERVEVEAGDEGLVFVDQWRELFLDEAGRYTVRLWRRKEQGSEELVPFGEDRIPLRRGQPLPFIPLDVVGPEGAGLVVQKPPLLDLVDVNLSLYRTSADLEQGRHMLGLPTVVTIGFAAGQAPDPLPLGPTKAIHIPPSPVGANGDAKLLEFTGQGLKELREAVAEKKQEMAALGARLVQRNSLTPEAAETVRMRQGAETSALQLIAVSASDLLSRLARRHAYWLALTDTPDDPEIRIALNTDFIDERLSPQDVNALLLAVQDGRISWTTWIHNLNRGEILPEGTTAEIERQRIIAEGGEDPLAARDEDADPEAA